MREQDLERMLFVVSLDRLLRRIISAYEIKRRIIINPNYNPLTSPSLLPAPLTPLFFPISNNHLVFLAPLTSFFISQNFSLFTSLSSFAHTSSKSSSTSHASSLILVVEATIRGKPQRQSSSEGKFKKYF